MEPPDDRVGSDYRTTTFAARLTAAVRDRRLDLLVCLALGAGTLLSRLPFRSAILYAWDSVNYAFALRSFDVAAEQPQPPGYIAYVGLARLLDAVTDDANASLVWLSIAASALAVIAAYLLGLRLYCRRAGLIAAVLLAASPLVWFYGEIALPHALDLLLVTVVALLLAGVRVGGGEGGGGPWAAAAALALAGGVRPQTLVFLLPLALWATWRVPWRRRLAALALLIVLCLVWAVPLVRSAGGLRSYLDTTRAYSARFERSTSLLRGAGLSGLAHNAAKVVQDTAYGAAPAPPAPPRLTTRDRRLLYALWAAPALLYYLGIHMGQQGMVFVFLPIPFLVAGAWLAGLRSQRVAAAIAVALVAAEAAVFLAAPVHPPGFTTKELPARRAIAANDRYFQKRFAVLERAFPPSDSAVVAGDWRWVEYYEPDYVLLRLGAADDPSGEGRPRDWPGDGAVDGVVLLGPRTAEPEQPPPYGRAVNVVLFDQAAQDLVDPVVPRTTVALPTSGAMQVVELWPGSFLRYDPPPVIVVRMR